MFRGIAAYLGLAIGDALGATVEFMTPAEIRHEYGTHQHIIGGGWLKLKAGEITDDTEMSLALGDAILAAGKVDPPAWRKPSVNGCAANPKTSAIPCDVASCNSAAPDKPSCRKANTTQAMARVCAACP